MLERTIFHDIRDKKVPADIVYEDEEVMAFKDIHPAAPTHLLFIPKKDADIIPSILDLTDETVHVPGLLIRKAQQFAKDRGMEGYRLTFHVGKGGGQVVFYIHLHLLSQEVLKK